MLLDPFEKQLDLPATFVKRCNRQWRKRRIVGQKYECLSRLYLFETDPTKVFGVILNRVMPIQFDHLIAHDSIVFVRRSGVDPLSIHVVFGTSHEKGAKLMELEQPGVVYISSVHNVERAGLYGHDVQHIDVVHLPVADMDKRRYVSPQIQKSMHLHSCFGLAKRGPIEQTQTKIYSCGVQGIDSCVQIRVDLLLGVKLSGTKNQSHSQVVIDTPIARVQSIRQRRALRYALDTHVVQLGTIGRETDFDVAQRLSPSQLSKSHDSEYICTRQGPYSGVSVSSIYDSAKGLPRYELHNLSKKSLSIVHD